MDIEVDPALAPLGIKLWTGVLEGIKVGQSRKEVFRALSLELKADLRERFPDAERIPNDPVVRSLRRLYWSIGIDPTKTRPASEALLRRSLTKELPMINDLVDAGNIASAETLVPIGLYDMDRVRGALRLRRAEASERFIGIGGKDDLLSEGVPVLSDEAGIIHIYPHRDSMRTRITEDCTKALIVACGARGIDDGLLELAVERTIELFDQLRR